MDLSTTNLAILPDKKRGRAGRLDKDPTYRKLLIDLWSDKTAVELAEMLGRSARQIERDIARLRKEGGNG